jgi:general secretion pathway protein L
MLIIALPHFANAASAGYAHVHSEGHTVLRQATGAASTLSAHAGEVVAVVPHSRLSWLAVTLPPGSQGPRLQGVLRGLLEDRLLEEPEQLHLVLEPHAQNVSKAGGTALVAVCHKQWLRDVLAPLQAAGLTVQRLVPELSPSNTPMLHVMGTPDFSQSVLSHAQGVSLLPPNTAHWSTFAPIANQNLTVHAEPSMVERVQQLLSVQPQLQTAAQRWVQSAQSDWDLAQGEWAQGRSQRGLRWLQATWQTVWHAPAWRPVRLGVLALLLVQVVGLNVFAWREHKAQQSQMAALNQILTQTFPAVTLVIDAPLQMQREVEALKQKSGAVSNTDFEPLLVALASVLPSDTRNATPTQLHFANQALRIHGVSFDSASANRQLKAKGLQLRDEGNDVWVLQAEGGK